MKVALGGMYVGKGKFCRKFLWCWLGLSLPSTFAHVSLPHSLSVYVFVLFLTRNDKIVFQKEACFKACGSIWDPVDIILHLGNCVSATYPLGRSYPISHLWEWEMVPDVARYPLEGSLPLFENHWYNPYTVCFTVKHKIFLKYHFLRTPKLTFKTNLGLFIIWLSQSNFWCVNNSLTFM